MIDFERYKGSPENSPIFITGIERSGSSIIARAVACCSPFRGKVTMMMENIALKELMDGYYSSINADRKGHYPLPVINESGVVENWRDLVLQELVKQGYSKRIPWFYKSNRLGQVWQLWHHAFPNAKWVIVRRKTGDVIESCMKTDYMKAYKIPDILQLVGAKDERDGWLWWIHEQEKKFVEMIHAGVNCKVVWPDRIASGDYQQLWETLEWLGLRWNSKIVGEVEKQLHKKQ